MKYKPISKQLEQTIVPLCIICRENPSREYLKTCSPECAKIYRMVWRREYGRTDKFRQYNREYYSKNKDKIRINRALNYLKRKGKSKTPNERKKQYKDA